MVHATHPLNMNMVALLSSSAIINVRMYMPASIIMHAIATIRFNFVMIIILILGLFRIIIIT